MRELFLFYFNSNKPGYTGRGGRVVSVVAWQSSRHAPCVDPGLNPTRGSVLDKFNLNGRGYKPLIQVRGSCPQQGRPQSKELKDEDTYISMHMQPFTAYTYI